MTYSKSLNTVRNYMGTLLNATPLNTYLESSASGIGVRTAVKGLDLVGLIHCCRLIQYLVDGSSELQSNITS